MHNIITVQTGSVRNGSPGRLCLSAATTMNAPRPTTKSRTVPGTVLIGSASRGKKIFDSIDELLISEMLPLATVPWKRFHPSRPANANTTYGTPPLERPATRPNTNEKMPAARSGWSTTQVAPRAVCR